MESTLLSTSLQDNLTDSSADRATLPPSPDLDGSQPAAIFPTPVPTVSWPQDALPGVPMAPEQAVYLKRLASRHFERQEGIYYGTATTVPTATRRGAGAWRIFLRPEVLSGLTIWTQTKEYVERSQMSRLVVESQAWNHSVSHPHPSSISTVRHGTYWLTKLRNISTKYYNPRRVRGDVDTTAYKNEHELLVVFDSFRAFLQKKTGCLSFCFA